MESITEETGAQFKLRIVGLISLYMQSVCQMCLWHNLLNIYYYLLRRLYIYT